MRYYDEEGYEVYPRPRRQSGFSAPWFMLALLCTLVLLGIGVLRFRPDLFVSTGAPTPAPLGNVGGQAPAVVRGTNPAPRVQATPIPGIAQNEQESQAQYDAAVRAAEPAPPAPVAAPLPLNSAGEPVIDAVQQQQLTFSAEMAAQEALDGVANARATDVASRPPDVSKADAETEMHRDLCHVPRADPHTCEQGLYKPTPVQP